MCVRVCVLWNLFRFFCVTKEFHVQLVSSVCLVLSSNCFLFVSKLSEMGSSTVEVNAFRVTKRWRSQGKSRDAHEGSTCSSEWQSLSNVGEGF